MPSLRYIEHFKLYIERLQFPRYSWVSLWHYAVNLTGAQPQMYIDAYAVQE